jgi:hypothetical protein
VKKFSVELTKKKGVSLYCNSKSRPHILRLLPFKKPQQDMAARRVLAKAQQTPKRKSKQSHKRFQALVLSGQLLDRDFGRPEKQPFDAADLRTEEERAEMLLWVQDLSVILDFSPYRLTSIKPMTF